MGREPAMEGEEEGGGEERKGGQVDPYPWEPLASIVRSSGCP